MGNRIYLEDIINKKKLRIKQKKYNRMLLLKIIRNLNERPSFYNAISKEGLSIIGEIKKASPSKGLIKKEFNPLKISNIYNECVDAISVLTEEDYFLGKDKYLQQVSNNVKIPTLCKDFIIDVNQIYNAKVLGASCVLLIVAVLDEKTLGEYIQVAHNLSMDALVEVHSKDEIDIAIRAGARIIGINNRDLKTFETNINTTLKLREYIPDGILTISESGIDKLEYLKELKIANIDGILVGESFMRSNNIEELSKEMRSFYDS